MITDEMVEKAARAVWRDQSGFEPEYEGCKGHWMRQARNVLTAVLPLIVEECAKAASEACWMHQGDDAYSQGMDAGARHQTSACVKAIRSLVPENTPNPLTNQVNPPTEEC